jgi:hypothetical protein
MMKISQEEQSKAQGECGAPTVQNALPPRSGLVQLMLHAKILTISVYNLQNVDHLFPVVHRTQGLSSVHNGALTTLFPALSPVQPHESSLGGGVDELVLRL